MPNTNTHFEFKGFDDWVEVFRGGVQTSSDGTTQNFSDDDLDEIIETHKPAPIVIGHPEVDDPAYGWSENLKRVGDVLLAKFSDVDEAFSKMVENKSFPNRSVRIGKNKQGKWYLKHVGWLGAAAPAIEGLKPVSFNEDESECLEFVSDAYTIGTIARTFRRLREFLIEKFDLETADNVLPEYQIDSLAEIAVEKRINSDDDNNTLFNKPDNGDTPVPKQYSEAEIQKLKDDAEAAGKASATAEFSSENENLKTQLSESNKAKAAVEFSTFANELLGTGQLTPALATGMVEFMQSLPVADVQFEFSQGEGDKKTTVKKSPIDWFKEFAKQLPKLVDLGESDAGADLSGNRTAQFNAPHGAVVDAGRLAIDAKAQEYMKANNCDYVEAVIAVSA